MKSSAKHKVQIVLVGGPIIIHAIEETSTIVLVIARCNELVDLLHALLQRSPLVGCELEEVSARCHQREVRVMAYHSERCPSCQASCRRMPCLHRTIEKRNEYIAESGLHQT